MRAVVRTMWIARLVAAVPVLLEAGMLAAAAPGRPATLTVVVGLLVVEAATLVATWRVVRSFSAGDQGDLLVRGGGRMRFADLSVQFRLETAELVAASIGFVAAGLTGSIPAAVVTGGIALLLALIWLRKREAHASFVGIHRLLAGDLDGAERALGPALRSRMPIVAQSARSLLPEIELRRGRPQASRRRLEALWRGGLDELAASVAVQRLAAGDGALAERWLAAPRGDTLFDRYLAALVGGTLGVHRADWDAALAAVRAPQGLPPWYVERLRMLEVAALRGAGRIDEADAVRSTLGPADQRRWLAIADPLLGRLVDGVVAARAAEPLAAAATTADPFAAPAPRVADALPSPGNAGGIVPVEGLALGRTTSATNRVLQVALVLLMVLLGLVQLPIDPPRGLIVIGIGLAGGLQMALARGRPPRGQPAVVFADRACVSRRAFPVWGSGPPAVLGAYAFALVVSLNLSAPGLGLAVPTVGLVAMVGLSGLARFRVLRVVYAAHFDPPARAAARVEALVRRGLVTGQLHDWAALVHLWAGDVASAERSAALAAPYRADRSAVQLWLAAGRGEFDLDWAIGRGDDEESGHGDLGDAYRVAVALALAALHRGVSDRVVHRVEAWGQIADQLPNRFGGLLRHLAARVAHDAGRGPPPPPDPDLAWLATVWPFAA